MASRERKLPLHLVPDEIEWVDPDGKTITVTTLDAATRYMLALDMMRCKRSFETVALRGLRTGLRELRRKEAGPLPRGWSVDGYCECGCGKKTTLARQSDTKMGLVKGRPRRFLPGHNLSQHKTPESEAHPGWRGDEADYFAKHKWFNRHHKRSGVCEKCGASGGRTEWANKDHLYKRLREDWLELCCSCHYRYDVENGLRRGAA